MAIPYTRRQIAGLSLAGVTLSMGTCAYLDNQQWHDENISVPVPNLREGQVIDLEFTLRKRRAMIFAINFELKSGNDVEDKARLIEILDMRVTNNSLLVEVETITSENTTMYHKISNIDLESYNAQLATFRVLNLPLDPGFYRSRVIFTKIPIEITGRNVVFTLNRWYRK